MALISASIPNLINGVSQQPPSLRLKTQAALQENGLSSVVNGLSKRPGTEHIASLGSITGADDAFIHTIRRDENEFYTLIVTTNDIFVYDKNGVSKTINGATTYLSGLTNPSQELAATTIADYTFILNKTKITAANTTTSSARNKEALVYVKQGDYSTTYTLRITKGGTVYTRSITTMASTQDTTSLTHNAELSIQTDRLATNLMFSNAPNSTYYGGSSGTINIPGISYTQYGNVIHIYATDGNDFNIETEDSRGDTHIFAFKDTAPDFKKLPPNGADGFVIKIAGDNNKGQDDYYVELQKDGTGGQVWKETLAPNISIGLDASTLPHQLVSEANGTFTFQQATYKERKVGDDDTNPQPSFIGLPLNDIFFHRNRLGFLADENIILGEAGEFDEFNYYKRTTLTLLDSDPIDVAVSNNKVSILKHAVPFNESLLLFSDLTQFRLTADDLLTPETVAIDVTTQFEASLDAKPVGAGRYVFFGIKRGKWAGVREYFVDVSAEVDDAADITAHVPNYLPGTINKMEASTNEDMLLLVTEDDPNAIYAYSYYWQGTDKLQSSWSRWTFEGKILNISFNKSDIDILVEYTNTDGSKTVTLERMNLSTDKAVELTQMNHAVLLDRRQIWDSSNSISTLNTPANSAGVQYVTDKGKLVTQAQAQAHVTGGGTVFVGTPYTFRYQFSEQVMKGNNNEPMSSGRLQLRNMTVVYSKTGYFETKVTPSTRTTSTNKFNARLIGSANNVIGQAALETGLFRFPVLSKAGEVEIEIQSDSYFPCVFQSAEWEGFFVMRSRRI
jgi:hypothetical protein